MRQISPYKSYPQNESQTPIYLYLVLSLEYAAKEDQDNCFRIDTLMDTGIQELLKHTRNAVYKQGRHHIHTLSKLNLILFIIVLVSQLPI